MTFFYFFGGRVQMPKKQLHNIIKLRENSFSFSFFFSHFEFPTKNRANISRYLEYVCVRDLNPFLQKKKVVVKMGYCKGGEKKIPFCSKKEWPRSQIIYFFFFLNEKKKKKMTQFTD